MKGRAIRREDKHGRCGVMHVKDSSSTPHKLETVEDEDDANEEGNGRQIDT